MKRKAVPFLMLALAMAAVFAGVRLDRWRMGTLVAEARADDGPKVVEIALPAGQKLISVSWRCFAACDLWPLTRAMYKQEWPQTYTFSNQNGETYRIKESAP